MKKSVKINGAEKKEEQAKVINHPALNEELLPPKEKSVKKINGFFVKKTVLFERSEFMVFRKNY